MTPTSEGSFKLFRFAGINVFLHWSWFIAAIYFMNKGRADYTSYVWSIYEYLFLFGIVLAHEFGHALACRQVGGQANQIVLWPLGGVAYVAPPPRAGAHLWSIAAGPLVNVILVPAFAGLLFLAGNLGWDYRAPDIYKLIQRVSFINLSLLIFNMLPIYPLDGGQILRSLLWFRLGPAKSLLVTTILGFLGVAGLAVLAVAGEHFWGLLLCAFVAFNCWRAFGYARSMVRVDSMPRHSAYACPSCQASPPAGALWVCGRCREPFDTFASESYCPRCATQFDSTQCSSCGNAAPFRMWCVGTPVPPKIYR